MDTKTVFISYKHTDFADVTKLCTLLDSIGVSYWIDSNDISGGAYAGRIVDGIKNCKIFLLCLSKLSCISPNVLNEVSCAFKRYEDDQSFTILPIYLEDITGIEDTDIYYYIGRQSAMFAYKDGFTQTFIQRIKSLLGIKENIAEESEIKPTKNHYYSYDYTAEVGRLELQQNFILKYDMPIYEKITNGRENLIILDVGSGVGKSIRKRAAELNKKGNVIQKIIGIEYDEKSVEVANQIQDGNVFYNVDVESPSFTNDLRNVCSMEGIEKFDIINISLVLLHLENPLKVLRILKRFLKPDGVFFIRDVDDGFTFGYPDEEGIIERITAMVNECETSGFRKSGRRIYWFMKDIGMKYISIENHGTLSEGMTDEELDAFYDMTFSWIQDDVKIMTERYPDSMKWKENYEFLMSHLDDVIDMFHTKGFVYVLGTLIVIASNKELENPRFSHEMDKKAE